MERQQIRGRTPRPRLGEDTRGAGGMVIEPAYTLVRAEIVVKGPILVHQEDDMLDRTEIGARGGDTGRLPSGGAPACRQRHAERTGHAGNEHFAPGSQAGCRNIPRSVHAGNSMS